VTDEVRIHNGGETGDVAAEELARLFADPAESWGNLEIAVEFPRGYASVHWSGFIDDQEAVGAGFLVRLGGESPLGDQDSPEILQMLDGGSEPFAATARHLLRAEDARWLVAQLGQSLRPTSWPDGRPLVWSEAMVDEAPWRALGRLEEPYEEGSVALSCDSVTLAAVDEPAWIGQRQLLLAKRALTDHEAETLPRTALWQVLRNLHDVADARWLALLARYPMPWLRSLVVTLDSLDGLTEAVERQPRLTELLVYARAVTLPAIASESLAALLLEGMDGDVIAAFLRGSRLPALQLLAVFADALAVPLDVSGLGADVVVHVEFTEFDDLECLRHTTGARALALALRPEHSVEDLVRGLAARAGLATWVSTLWEHADEAVALARARGIQLEAR